MSELSKQKLEIFCRAYVFDTNGNATRAAVKAGYSERSAAELARRVMRRPEVKARIAELKQEFLADSGYDADSVRRLIVDRLVGIVATKPTDILRTSSPDSPTREEDLKQLAELSGGQNVLDFGDALVVPSSALSPEQEMAVKSFRIVRDPKSGVPSVDLQLYDPVSAAKLLAEIAGIKAADGQVNVSMSFGAVVADVEREADGVGSECTD